MNTSNSLIPEDSMEVLETTPAQGLPVLAQPAVEPADLATVTVAEAAGLELSPAQRVAIVKLTAGCSRRDAAVAAGVDRRTLYRWMNDDIHFQAAFNVWQRDVTNTVQSQLLAASQDAAVTVLKAIRGGDARMAWNLLNAQGMIAPPKHGPTDAGELRRRQQLDEKKKEIAERRERSQMRMDEVTILE